MGALSNHVWMSFPLKSWPKNRFIWRNSSGRHFSFKYPDFDALNFVVMRLTLRLNAWKELKMTVVISSREAYSKNIKIGVIKSLKLMSFKCKINLRKCCRSRSTFWNEFDPSSNLLLLEYIPSAKSNCGLRNQQLTLCAHL